MEDCRPYLHFYMRYGNSAKLIYDSGYIIFKYMKGIQFSDK